MSLVTVLSYAVAVMYTAVFVYIIFVWNKEDRNNRRNKQNSAAQFFKQYEGKTLRDVLDDLDKKK